MVKRLRDNLSSKYFEAGNRMTSRTARRRIVAYVESYDDIFFWRTILSSFENSTRYFRLRSILPTVFRSHFPALRLEHLVLQKHTLRRLHDNRLQPNNYHRTRQSAKSRGGHRPLAAPSGAKNQTVASTQSHSQSRVSTSER